MQATDTADPTVDTWGDPGAHPSVVAFLLKYKLLTLSGIALIVALAAVTALGIATSTSAPLSDTTTCARWSSAHSPQQDAYGVLWLREHGALPNGARDMLSVEGAIDKSCIMAFSSGDENRVTLYQASMGDY